MSNQLADGSLAMLVRVAVSGHGGPLATMLEFAASGRVADALAVARTNGEHPAVVAVLQDLDAAARAVEKVNATDLGQRLITQTAALKSAIRAYTVDAKNEAGEDVANGPAEEASGELAACIIDASIALRARGQHVAANRLLKAAERDAELEADRIRALRVAANAYFREEFGVSKAPRPNTGGRASTCSICGHTYIINHGRCGCGS